MTGLRYNDDSIPLRVSAKVFSPFIPGSARDSATPGFLMLFTLENLSGAAVEVSLAGFLNNPLASALPERRLTNTVSQKDGVTSLFFETAAKSRFPIGHRQHVFFRDRRQALLDWRHLSRVRSAWGMPMEDQASQLHAAERASRVPDRGRSAQHGGLEQTRASDCQRWLEIDGLVGCRRRAEDRRS